jgi:hypothetical protein
MNTQSTDNTANVSLSQFATMIDRNKGTVHRKAKDLGIDTSNGLTPESQAQLKEAFGYLETVDTPEITELAVYEPKVITPAIYEKDVIRNGLSVDMAALEVLEGELDSEYEEIQLEDELESAEVDLLQAKVMALKAKKERNEKAKRERELNNLKNSIKAEILGDVIGAK